MSNYATCALHGRGLERSDILDSGAEAAFDDPSSVAGRLFPNARTEDSCSDCRNAEKAWREQNDAYHATNYTVVDDGNVHITIRLGEANEELKHFLVRRNINRWAFLTAWNPLSQPLPEDENAERQASLISLLRNQNYDFLQAYGIGEDPEWEAEESLFILDITREAAVEIARHFKQNAILWGERDGEAELVWCI